MMLKNENIWSKGLNAYNLNSDNKTDAGVKCILSPIISFKRYFHRMAICYYVARDSNSRKNEIQSKMETKDIDLANLNLGFWTNCTITVSVLTNHFQKHSLSFFLQDLQI